MIAFAHSTNLPYQQLILGIPHHFSTRQYTRDPRSMLKKEDRENANVNTIDEQRVVSMLIL